MGRTKEMMIDEHEARRDCIYLQEEYQLWMQELAEEALIYEETGDNDGEGIGHEPSLPPATIIGWTRSGESPESTELGDPFAEEGVPSGQGSDEAGERSS